MMWLIRTERWILGPWGIGTGCTAAALAALSFVNCGPAAPEANPPPAPTAAPSTIPNATPSTSESAPPTPEPSAAPTLSPTGMPASDVCANNPPPPHPFNGLLAKARCDQEMFLTMAGYAGQLGVECKYCHAPNPADAKKEDYPKMTPKKEIANWMGMHLMKAIKPADGSPMKCKSCHTDIATGKPLVKFLGTPRDPEKAQEWMSMVMVNKFVTAKGEKLKCKSCHVDNFTKPGFQAKVILKTEQIPPH